MQLTRRESLAALAGLAAASFVTPGALAAGETAAQSGPHVAPSAGFGTTRKMYPWNRSPCAVALDGTSAGVTRGDSSRGSSSFGEPQDRPDCGEHRKLLS